MGTKNIREKLRERLRAPEQAVEQIAHIIEKYDINVTIRNFDDYGIFFRAADKKNVRVVTGNMRDTTIHIPNPHSDIVIIYVDGLLAGWIDYEKLDDLQDRMSVDLKSLNPMPDVFLFRQGCEHMSVHGGIYTGDSWTCLGCNQRLVFNE